MSLFSSHNYDKITADIPKLRKNFKLMLKSMNFEQLGYEVINLLDSISKSSKSVAVEMVRDNFTQLTNIFEQMKDEIERLSDFRLGLPNIFEIFEMQNSIFEYSTGRIFEYSVVRILFDDSIFDDSIFGTEYLIIRWTEYIR